MKIKHLGLLGLLSLASSGALAQDFYLGGSLGQTSPDASEFDNDTGFRLTLGYQVNPNFALEASYADLGKFDLKRAYLGELNDMLQAEFPEEDMSGLTLSGVNVGISGIEVAALATIPVSEKISLFGRAGVFIWDTDFNFSFQNFGSFSESDDGNDVFFGIGAEYATSERLSLKVEFNRYGVDDTDVDFLGVGLNFRL